MPYTISFYPEGTLESVVTSKEYIDLYDLIEYELGDKTRERDLDLEHYLRIGNSYSSGIGYDANGNIFEMENSAVPDCSQEVVRAVGGSVCFYFGYPPAFVIEYIDTFEPK